MLSAGPLMDGVSTERKVRRTSHRAQRSFLFLLKGKLNFSGQDFIYFIFFGGGMFRLIWPDRHSDCQRRTLQPAEQQVMAAVSRKSLPFPRLAVCDWSVSTLGTDAAFVPRGNNGKNATSI